MGNSQGIQSRPVHDARTDPAAMVDSLLRTWRAGAGRITVTFGGAHGDQWDIERSSHRVAVSI